MKDYILKNGIWYVVFIDEYGHIFETKPYEDEDDDYYYPYNDIAFTIDEDDMDVDYKYDDMDHKYDDDILLPHMNVNTKKIKCPYCDFQANTRFYMQSHVNNKHKGIYYKCSMCDKQFSLKGNLQRHINNVHVRSKFFRCQLCDYKTVDRYNLKRHLNTHLYLN